MRLLDQQYNRTPYYGSPKMTLWLKTRGYAVNHKRVERLMGLQAIYPKLNTSKPHPEHKIYPYLLRGVEIDHADQVWSADITYIRKRSGFLYLVAVIDWFSHAFGVVLSWRLSNTLEGSFCMEALEAALRLKQPEIFNTDQGTQFTSGGFTDILQKRRIAISMDVFDVR